MLLKITFFVLFLFLCTTKLFAQLTGCQIGNTVYTQLNGNLNVTIVAITVSVRNFDNPNLSILPNACPRAVNVVNVTTGGLGVTTCVANGNILSLGQTVTYTRLDPPVQCNIDDYTFPLTAAAGILGLFVIKRRKII